MKPYLFSILILCWFGSGTASQNNKITAPLNNADTGNYRSSIPAPVSDSISLIAVGDIMFGSNFPDSGTLAPADGKNLMRHFRSLLKNADITFGNSEGVFLDSGGVAKDSGSRVYCFREPTRYARYFVDNGFDLISVANNHIADFGELGLLSTIATLKALPLHFAGLQNHPSTIIRVRNTRIGFAAFAPHKYCNQLNDYAAAVARIKKLKRECDVLMVSFHAGAEGKQATHVTRQTEMFFKRNRGNVYEFAHLMIDAGADIIIGHGPHVPRAMELYRNKFIAYSLGNFCTYGMFNLEGVNGIAPLLKIFVNKKGDFLRGNIISVKQEGEGGPIPDKDFGAYNLIRELTASDFPGGHLQFTDSMAIEKKQ